MEFQHERNEWNEKMPIAERHMEERRGGGWFFNAVEFFIKLAHCSIVTFAQRDVAGPLTPHTIILSRVLLIFSLVNWKIWDFYVWCDINIRSEIQLSPVLSQPTIDFPPSIPYCIILREKERAKDELHIHCIDRENHI